MESCEKAFQAFIESLEPNLFLALGNEAVEALGKFHQYILNQVASQHLLALVKVIFSADSEQASASAFFAGQTLEFLASWLGDKLTDEDFFMTSLRLLHLNRANLTASGYIGQFIRHFAVKKNKSFERVLMNEEVTSWLLDCLGSLAVGLVIREIIENLPEACKVLFRGLLNRLIEGHDEISDFLACEVITRTLKFVGKNSAGLIEEEMIRLFLVSVNHSGHFFKILKESLKLPTGNRVKNLALKVIHENTEHLTLQLQRSRGQMTIDVIQVAHLSILSDFCNMNYLIGSSSFINLSTVMQSQHLFFEEVWNSQLHLAFFNLISASLASRSNSLLEAVKNK
jgi:hypothetical protein